MRKTKRRIEKLKVKILARAQRATAAKLGRNVQATPGIIEEFMLTRWGQPTVLRHKLHVETCERLDCEELIMPFTRFVEEVLTAPEAARDSMLAIEGLEPYQPFQSYPAYVEPTKQEQKLEFYTTEMAGKMGHRQSQRNK